VFEAVVGARIAEGLVGGKSLSVDARCIKADSDQPKHVPGDEAIGWPEEQLASRAVREYLNAQDQDVSKGYKRGKPPKAISLTDPQAAWATKRRRLPPASPETIVRMVTRPVMH
jgi:hypothetical protein